MFKCDSCSKESHTDKFTLFKVGDRVQEFEAELPEWDDTFVITPTQFWLKPIHQIAAKPTFKYLGIGTVKNVPLTDCKYKKVLVKFDNGEIKICESSQLKIYRKPHYEERFYIEEKDGQKYLKEELIDNYKPIKPLPSNCKYVEDYF
jgi:hypothetical protein